MSGAVAIICVMNEGNRSMNRMIASARRGGGLLDALHDADMSGGRQQRLQDAMVAYETACREGREIDAEMADTEIEKLLTEGREARAAEAAQTEQPPIPVSSFDGGVRTGIRNGRAVPRRRARPGIQEESAGQLFARAIVTSSREQRDSVKIPAWATGRTLS